MLFESSAMDAEDKSCLDYIQKALTLGDDSINAVGIWQALRKIVHNGPGTCLNSAWPYFPADLDFHSHFRTAVSFGGVFKSPCNMISRLWYQGIGKPSASSLPPSDDVS